MPDKDFAEYAARRLGLPPRPLTAQMAPRIADYLSSKYKYSGTVVNIVELGFSHANDSRFICELMYDRFGTDGWHFFGFDHEGFFMPENLLDSPIGKKVSANISLIPAMFEDIASSRVLLPERIDYFHSSKSITLCAPETFPLLVSEICRRITPQGVITATLHLHAEETGQIWNPQAFIDCLNGGSVEGFGSPLAGFTSHYRVEEESNTFALVAMRDCIRTSCVEDPTLGEGQLNGLGYSVLQ